MLISAWIGLENRATIDVDVTLQNFPLDIEHAERMVREILKVPLEDNLVFEVKELTHIIEEAEYPGIRISLEAHLQRTRIPLRIDISTGDIITPRAIKYQYKLMLEDRAIFLWTYTLETVLAEKIETILSRSLMNTRLRDFYEVYILQNFGLEIDSNVFSKALLTILKSRGSTEVFENKEQILNDLTESTVMKELWESYRRNNSYASVLRWNDVLLSVKALCFAVE